MYAVERVYCITTSYCTTTRKISFSDSLYKLDAVLKVYAFSFGNPIYFCFCFCVMKIMTLLVVVIVAAVNVVVPKAFLFSGRRRTVCCR